MTVLPPPKRIRDLFADLLGREVDISPCLEPVVPTLLRPCAIGVYVTDDIKTGAVVCADLELAARAGAALSLVPKAGADAAIEGRYIPQNLLDNFAEVINVFAGLFNVPNAPHLKLYSVVAPDETPPADLVPLVRRVTRRVDLRLAIDGYGLGHLAVVLPN
ncbi:MAG TPA: hypothetical protein VFK66_00205 [Oryzihumus sp.]|nr:hypothetical protein [Oryzihumus sp.]